MSVQPAPIRTPISANQGLVYFSSNAPWVRWFKDIEALASRVDRTSHALSSAQLDKTDATFTTVPGLELNLKKGRYQVFSVLYVAADGTGGHKYRLGGTALAARVVYQINALDNTTSGYVITSRQTGLGGAGAGATGATGLYVEITGTVEVTAAGTITVDFAQSSASGTSSVLDGSYLTAVEV